MQVDTVVDLQPTSPLRTQQDIDAALALLGDADLVVSVTEPSHNPYYTLAEARCPAAGSRLSKPAAFRPAAGCASGVGPERLHLRVAARRIAAGHRATASGACAPSRTRCRAARSVDIDDLEDFELAQWLYCSEGEA